MYYGLHLSRWGNVKHMSKIESGLDSGPLVLFNKGSDAVIISPFSSFMAAQASYNLTEQTASWGLLGNAKEVPAGFQYGTAVYYSNLGIQEVKQISFVMIYIFFCRDGSEK